MEEHLFRIVSLLVFTTHVQVVSLHSSNFCILSLCCSQVPTAQFPEVKSALIKVHIRRGQMILLCHGALRLNARRKDDRPNFSHHKYDRYSWNP